eukprot:CAMPEP_0181078636 /NCGR_PEP_ID=MMETSP1071-20121207/1592_1 /TAXON_ID=35127 /ORGANISM="Thalassiosira sp., Strain NH16" /LENGTH=745 /DNA_ID=CAMNT_0023159965 /DNA_START=457 /DNA_END=2694 /DNA_ORIENTATION=-
MPPPPPTAPGSGSPLIRSTPAMLSVPRAPNTATTRVPTAFPSSSVATARTLLGTPSPLAAKISVVPRQTTYQQAVFAGNEHLSKKATPIVVPSPIIKPPQHQPRPAVPHPVLSSEYSSSSTKITTHVAPNVGMQQRVMPRHIASTLAPQISSTQAMKRVAGTTAPASTPTKPHINGRLGVNPTMVSGTVAIQSVAAIPAPPPPAPSILAHPTALASTVSHASHLPMGNPAMPPPPPDNISVNTGNSSGNASKRKSGHPLRRGKWTSEEEAYAHRLINEFKAGLLPLTDGTTLRNFLSKLLNCDPMRISKKFVGNNCIGKQVFRRRVADINRLTPDQIQHMRVELGELERRFFDRVAQTNRVKSPGVSTTMATGAALTAVPANATINIINVGGKMREELDMERPPTPPWLRPPATYRPKGKFAEKCIKTESTVAMPPPVAQLVPKVTVSSTPPLVDVKSDAEMAMVAMQRSGSSLDQLAKAASNEDIPRTESALEQLARTASAAKFVEDIVNGESSLGDEQSEGKTLSKSTLQGSFEALMSMDIHSVENLVELAASSNSTAILSELTKTYTDSVKKNGQSSANLSSRMESFIKSLSSANLLKSGMDSQQALGSLLHANASTNNLSVFDSEKFSNRVESSTGFTQLRAEDGLANGSHNSVDDFLSLVAYGDIPHQDENLLSVPLQKVMQNGSTVTTPGAPCSIGSKGSKRKLSQQQLANLASRLAGSSANLTDMAYGASALKKRQKK